MGLSHVERGFYGEELDRTGDVEELITGPDDDEGDTTSSQAITQSKAPTPAPQTITPPKNSASQTICDSELDAMALASKPAPSIAKYAAASRETKRTMETKQEDTHDVNKSIGKSTFLNNSIRVKEQHVTKIIGNATFLNNSMHLTEQNVNKTGEKQSFLKNSTGVTEIN